MPAATDPPTRRSFLAAVPAVALGTTVGAASARGAYGYRSFLEQVRSDALAQGVPESIVDAALEPLAQPNARVVQLDRHQPEFTLTWTEYEARVLPPSRLDEGRDAFKRDATLLGDVRRRWGVDPGVIIGIWGLESDFGAKTGSYGVFDSLATLAYDGRRGRFFRAELMAALRIAARGAVPVDRMLSSYAGAMGQPQFMPSAYLRYAAAFDGGDRADIWGRQADVFASIANYLARSGWQAGEPWGQRVRLTRPVDPSLVGRDRVRSLGAWEALGVRRTDGTMFSRSDVSAGLLQPDGAGGDAFLVYRNFEAIRRYNPSDFYALAVGLLGSAST